MSAHEHTLAEKVLVAFLAHGMKGSVSELLGEVEVALEEAGMADEEPKHLVEKLLQDALRLRMKRYKKPDCPSADEVLGRTVRGLLQMAARGDARR